MGMCRIDERGHLYLEPGSGVRGMSPTIKKTYRGRYYIETFNSF